MICEKVWVLCLVMFYWCLLYGKRLEWCFLVVGVLFGVGLEEVDEEV